MRALLPGEMRAGGSSAIKMDWQSQSVRGWHLQSHHLSPGAMQWLMKKLHAEFMSAKLSHFKSSYLRATWIRMLEERTEPLCGRSRGRDCLSCLFVSPVPPPQQMPRKRGSSWGTGPGGSNGWSTGKPRRWEWGGHSPFPNGKKPRNGDCCTNPKQNKTKLPNPQTNSECVNRGENYKTHIHITAEKSQSETEDVCWNIWGDVSVGNIGI